jgi:hypothetical protein
MEGMEQSYMDKRKEIRNEWSADGSIMLTSLPILVLENFTHFVFVRLYLTLLMFKFFYSLAYINWLTEEPKIRSLFSDHQQTLPCLDG